MRGRGKEGGGSKEGGGGNVEIQFDRHKKEKKKRVGKKLYGE